MKKSFLLAGTLLPMLWSSHGHAQIGLDLTGTYVNNGIVCISNGQITQVSDAAGFTTFTETTVILGNQITEFDQSGACQVNHRGSVFFQPNTDSGGVVAGTYNIPQLTASVPSGRCTLDQTIVSNSGGVLPKDFSATFSDGQAVRGRTGTFIWNANTGDLFLLADLYSVAGSPADVCYYSYSPVLTGTA